MEQVQEQIERLNDKENKNSAEQGKQAPPNMEPHATIMSYDEMTDLIDLKTKLAKILFTRSKPKTSSIIKSATRYTSLTTVVRPIPTKHAHFGKERDPLPRGHSDLSRTPTLSDVSLYSPSGRISAPPRVGSVISIAITPTPSLEIRNSSSSPQPFLGDHKTLLETSKLYQQLSEARVYPDIAMKFIASLLNYLPSLEQIDNWVFASSDLHYQRIQKRLKTLSGQVDLSKQNSQLIRLTHEVLLNQQSGEGTYVATLNELSACLHEFNFLLSTIQEEGQIIYPPSRPDTNKEKRQEYAQLVMDLRKMVDVNDQPDFEQRQAYLIKTLWNSIQSLISDTKNELNRELKENKKTDKLVQQLLPEQKKVVDLIDDLVGFCDDIRTTTCDGAHLNWELAHKDDHLLNTYRRELSAIVVSLNQAAKELEAVKNSEEYNAIKNSLYKIKCTVNDHRLDPRAKLAKIYIHAKEAELKIKHQCTKLVDKQINTVSAAYKNNYMSARKTLSGIRCPIKCKGLSTVLSKQPTVATPTSSAVSVGALASQPSASSLHPDSLLPIDISPVAVSREEIVAATTSRQLDKYENNEGFFSRLFNLTSNERLQLAQKYRNKALALIEGNTDADNLSQFIRSVKEEQRNLETANLNRNPIAWALSCILPNFIFSTELRMLTTFKKIISNIETLAKNDEVLQQALDKANVPNNSEEHKPTI